MLICIIKFPKIKIKRLSFETFWIVPLLSAVIILLFKLLPFDVAFSGLTSSTGINPIKILVLFFSMTFLSVILDELGFFEVLANHALRKVKHSQFALFLILYVLTSVLTVFTSNDIIILTFTPFIIFFSKRANISPIPYLVSEFIAANTWSMMLIIGNPTNIYLASSCNIDFFEYISKMFLPTVLAGIVSLGLLLLIFRKSLKKPLDVKLDNVKIKNKPLLIINLICLSMCTLLLSISSYLPINIEMYLISLSFSIILLLSVFVYSLIKKDFTFLLNGFKRLPWTLLPFILSMFIIVLSLKHHNVTLAMSNILSHGSHIFVYGIVSTLMCNLINNIPISVLFSEVVDSSITSEVYASIIGTNIGAFVTPIGALAGIMWLSILKQNNVKFSFLTFTKYGIMLAIPTLIAALIGLSIVL
jgi:arsenical pump membrane protein